MTKRKNILLTVAALLLTVLLASCGMIEAPEGAAVNVTYVYNNGEENKIETVYRIAFARPDDPVRSGYSFAGWCTDAELENFYNFEEAPASDITLYAKWELDYAELLEDVSREAATFGVKVRAKDKSIFSTNVSQGSGVIYKHEGGFYYVITNYHVLEGSTDLPKNYYVYDVYGNEYQAARVAGDPSYDLSVLRFEADPKIELAVAKIDQRIPSNKEALICLSTPSGRFNTVTVGKAARYEPVTMDSESSASNVTFDVLWLDCYAEHGSSGGAVLDTDLEIVGITYAVASDSYGNFKYSIAIPAEKVLEFLTKYGIS